MMWSGALLLQQGGDADGDIYGNVYVYSGAYCTYHIGD